MDLTPFKQDIDELLGEFADKGFVGFADMKRVWVSRKFSFIFEAGPKKNSAVFMQGLYSHCLRHMVSAGSLSWRLGGLYCLYSLFGAQPYKSSFKIYMSVGELMRLKELVIDAKQNGIEVVHAMVKNMLQKNMLLFGFVDIADHSFAERVDDVTRLNENRLKIAQERLFTDTRIEDYLHMDLGAELGLEELKMMSEEYARAKDIAIKGASGTVDVDDVKHIASDSNKVGETVEDLVRRWDSQRESLFKQTDIEPHNEVAAMDNFEEELEHLLSED